jgi:hypothetical protein
MKLSIEEFKKQLSLEDQTRLKISYSKVNQLIEEINSIEVYPPLGWVMAWDLVKSKLKNYDSPADAEEYETNQTLVEEDIWWMFVRDIDVIDLTFNSDALDGRIYEWMIQNNILIYVPEEEGDQD